MATDDWGVTDFYPIVTGHEIIGTISHVGKEVTKFKVGDRVGWGVFADNCGECDICDDGHPELCL